LLFYSTLTRPKLEFPYVVWNSVTSTCTRKLERIQWKSAVLCQNCFFNASDTHEDFKKIKTSYFIRQKTFYRCIIFIFCLFWFIMLPVSFGRYRY
jgi:hypothetical protein